MATHCSPWGRKESDTTEQLHFTLGPQERGKKQTAVGSECRMVLPVCEASPVHRPVGRLGKVVDVKGVPSLKGLRNL